MSEKFKIGERTELGPVPKGRGVVYDELIKSVKEKKVAGAYPVTVGDMEAKKLYGALANKLKKDRTIRPRVRGNTVYLEIPKKEK